MITLNAAATVERKFPQLPRFICIPFRKVAPWGIDSTTTVEGTINGVETGRRSLKRWDDRNCWFIELPEPLCRKAKIETGDRVKLSLKLASEELPKELSDLLSNNDRARANWEKMTVGQKRMLREEILAAKQSVTRARKAAKALKGG
jgi:hypothetical protein